MALATQALHGRHAVAKWVAQTTQGTPVTATTAIGVGNHRMVSDADIRRVLSIGSATPIVLKPGISVVEWSVTQNPVQNGDFLARAARASGILPWQTLLFGYVDETSPTPVQFGYQVEDTKINTVEIGLEAGGMLSATYTGFGFEITEVAVAAVANITDAPFMSYEGVFLKGGAAYEIRSFRMSIDNNIQVVTVIPGTAPSAFKRGPSYQIEGHLLITGEVTRFQKSAINMQGDTISDFALNLTCTDVGGGGNAIQLAIANAKFGQETFEMAPDGMLMFTTPWEATGITITNT